MDNDGLGNKYVRVKQNTEDSFLIEYCSSDVQSSDGEEYTLNITFEDHKEIHYANEKQCREMANSEDSNEDKCDEYMSQGETLLWAEQLVDQEFPKHGDQVWISVNENEESLPKIEFTVWPGNTGPQIHATATDEAVYFFKLFFTEELIADIVAETNAYVNSVNTSPLFNKWTRLTAPEFYGFIGVILNMSTIIVPELPDYWSDKMNSKIPFFHHNFTFQRFNQIFFALHMKSNDPNRDGIMRNNSVNMRQLQTDTVWEYFNDKYSEYFVPGRDICIAEAIIQKDGRIRFIPYDAEKPTKSHIRIYVLMDSESGYIYHIQPYHGKASWENFVRPDMPENARIILHLYNSILERIPTAQGYHIYTEHASVILAEELLKMKCYLTGIVKNPTNLPTELNKLPDQVNAYRRNNTMVLSWQELTDKTPLVLLSTYYNAEMVAMYRNKRDNQLSTVKKPKVVLNFKSFMAGVDLADQYGGIYCFLKDSATMWWRKLFFFGMHTCVINSYVLYSKAKSKNAERPLVFQKFVKLLVDHLVRDFAISREQEGLSTGVQYMSNDVSDASQATHRLDGKLHIIRKASKRDCVVCSVRKVKGLRRETSDYCDTCPRKPRMHMGNCFERYHTLEEFRMPMPNFPKDEQ